MSETMLIGIGAAALMLLMLVAVVSQRLEAARQARLRRARVLLARIRRLWELLTDLPPELLGRDLKLVIVQALASDMNEYAALGHGNEVKRQRAQLKELADRLQGETENPDAPIRFKDAKQAQAVRTHLRPLQVSVKSMLLSRQIDRATAQQFVTRIGALNGETLFHIHVEEARKATQQYKPDLAAHKLTTCQTELQRINTEGHWNQHLQQLQQMIASLEQHGGLTPEEGEEIVRIKAEQNIQEPQPTGELARAVEEMAAEEDSWKKRADYD